MQINQFQQPTSQQQINPLDYLYDFERRFKDGMITVETGSDGVSTVSIRQKNPHEADQELEPVTLRLTAEQMDDIDLDIETQTIELKKQKLQAVREFDRQIKENTDKSKTIVAPLRKTLKKLEAEFGKKAK